MNPHFVILIKCVHDEASDSYIECFRTPTPYPAEPMSCKAEALAYGGRLVNDLNQEPAARSGDVYWNFDLEPA